ncbi:MAG: methylenetetrahydrofolate--tRNA-(uracil(54)-C(5))-methyltransferase (FADH(2)-oxidizing) TrmFO [Thermoanaerobaculia bacterium]
MEVIVVGGGFAGVECCWQLAKRGHRVKLFEMRPRVSTAAHQSANLAEMVCSNSFRSDNPQNAVGLLKREMEALGSLVMACARETAVPAGDALAVDREAFAVRVTAAIEGEALVEIVREECPALPPDGIAVVATGPLTSAKLSESIRNLLGEGALYFYDSMAPIVTADSLDPAKIYRASRYGKGEGDDYLNCPLDREQYEEFISDLLSGETVPVHDFEKGVYFEGCLPIEVMAERGIETLRHGPLKPMGLEDPRTGRRPHAVVQLRQDDLAREHYNLVGFQTKLKVGEQKRIFRKIPGLENGNFVRFGMLHRNTYIHSPAHLDRFFRMKSNPGVFFAGQITGVEGYLESAATGLYAGRTIAQLLEGTEPVPAPFDTALGSLSRHCSQRPRTKTFEPMNVTFGMIEDSSHATIRDRAQRRRILCARALASIESYRAQTHGRPSGAAAFAG